MLIDKPLLLGKLTINFDCILSEKIQQDCAML